MQQRFIEHDLPLAEISEASAREKNIRHGHPSTLHIWWARRPLAASRATTLAALLDDPGPHEPDKRRELKDLIKEIAPWEAVKNGNNAAIEQVQEMVKEQYEERPKVLDPFAGGGSIPLEALRLGAETYASDYNPVAVFIEKATLEWPQKFGVEVELPEEEDNDGLGMGGKKVNLLAYLVEKWANKILEEAREEIGQFYPTETGEGLVGKRDVDPDQEGWTPVGYLWARTIPCQNPTCGAIIPLIKQYWLAKKDDKKIAYRPIVNEVEEEVGFELLRGEGLKTAIENGFDPKDGTISRANASCPVCGQVNKSEQVRQLARDGQMGERLLAVVFHHPDETGKKYRLATEHDRQLFEEAEAYLEEKVEQWSHLENPLPEEKLAEDPRNLWCYKYGITEFRDMFNSRQQLAQVTFLERIKSDYDRIAKDAENLISRIGIDVNAEEIAKAVVGSLSIISGNMLDLGSRHCAWEPIAEAIRHLFGRQAIPMTWDYGEVNPIGGSSGSIQLCTSRFCKVITSNSFDTRKGSAIQSSATDLTHTDDSIDAVITDPPYYDNVPYAALSDFFYVWWKRAVGEYFPELFSTPTAPKSNEAIMEPTRHDDKEEAKSFFESMIAKSFQEMHRVLRPEGVAVVVYAYKTTEGWETMLNGLVDAGFVVTGSWPLHTESKTRLRAAQSAALASSIYMVCRKSEREELGFWSDIQPEIKSRVEEKLQQFWEADVIRGGDFFISAIGPGMEAYSRYDRVETYSGEEITVHDLLQYIRSVATDFLVHRLLRNGSAESVDKEGQFYLTYRWTFRDTRVEYDDALRIAKAEGVDLERLADADTFIKKTRKYIYVHGPQDRDEIDEVHNMVDAAQLACRMWEQGRKDDIGPMLAKYGYSQSPSFWQFCQAIAECLPEGNKEKQWLEGMLMGKNKYQEAEASGDSAASEGQIEIEFED
jgi:adenine-specific DNA methylase